MIMINKNPAGRIGNFVLGLCFILDGLVSVLSAGFLHGNLSLRWTGYITKRYFIKLRKERARDLQKR